MKKNQIGRVTLWPLFVVASVFGLVLFGALVFMFIAPKTWNTYENARYGFSVDYSSDWELGEAPENNDGRTFSSPSGALICRAYGFQNALTNDEGNPQTLDEFIIWLENTGVQALEEETSTFSQRPARTLLFIHMDDEVFHKAVYTLDEEQGYALDCYADSLQTLHDFDSHFSRMKDSFKIQSVGDVVDVSDEVDVCLLFEEDVDRCWCDETNIAGPILVEGTGSIQSENEALELVEESIPYISANNLEVERAVEITDGFYNVFTVDEFSDEQTYSVYKDGTIFVTQCGV